MKISHPAIVSLGACLIAGTIAGVIFMQTHQPSVPSAAQTTLAPPATVKQNGVSLQITTPLPSQTIAKSIDAAITVDDKDGRVGKVEYVIGSTVRATVNKPPYHASLSIADLADGPYTLVVRVLDRSGKLLVSQSVIITVKSTAKAPAKTSTQAAVQQTTGGSTANQAPPASPVAPLAGLALVPWSGGSAYYGSYGVPSAAGWTNPAFFPVAAWFMRANQQSEVDSYKTMGFNTDIAVEDNASLPMLQSSGVFAIPQDTTGSNGATVGYTLYDEADMTYNAGNDPWTGVDGWNTCTPIQDNGGACGYTVMQQVKARYPVGDGRLHYANYGKGIFPGWEADAGFAQFVNNYTTIVSDDLYWYTDSDVCSGAQGPTMLQGSGPISIYTGLHDLTAAECRRAANYGAIVDRMRALDAVDGKRQPVYAFVETGSPFSSGGTITGPQVEGAVMSSLIHGANGIIYFKHNFGGSCVTNDGLLDCAGSTRPNVTKINGYIHDLASVLNSQSYQYNFGSRTDTMLKWYNGSAYIFAMGQWGATGMLNFTLPSGLGSASSVQVLYEGRTIPVSSGSFSDTFAAENSYHIYKITP